MAIDQFKITCLSLLIVEGTGTLAETFNLLIGQRLIVLAHRLLIRDLLVIIVFNTEYKYDGKKGDTL